MDKLKYSGGSVIIQEVKLIAADTVTLCVKTLKHFCKCCFQIQIAQMFDYVFPLS